MGKVTVVDSICGSGKSSWAFEKMKQDSNERFIYITPYLDEVERCVNTCDNRYFVKPSEDSFGSKLADLNNLLKNGENIASTHALFKISDKTTLKYLKEMNYTLILDEVMDVVNIIKISKDDLSSLFELKYIEIEEDTKRVIWINRSYKGDFNKYKKMIDSGNVYFIKNTFMLWTFPINILNAMQRTYILTYLFKGQIQRCYYDMHKVEYEYKSVEKINDKFELVDYKGNQNLSHIKNLINIYDGKMNQIGDSKDLRVNPLSKGWYDNQKKRKLDGMKVLSRNMSNYFNKLCCTKSEYNMWTTFKDYKKDCKGKGYIKGYVVSNARATNEYANKESLAYCINVFYNPMITDFFRHNGVVVDQDTYALSELVQWIFRSRLRNGEEINLYIPSKRMRELLEKWLGYF